MKLQTHIRYRDRTYEIDLGCPLDLSIPVGRKNSPNAFYLPAPRYTTVEEGGFTGNVTRGGSCNVENILFSPHGNGTHTECAGHIAVEAFTVNSAVKEYFFPALLISITPGAEGDDRIITGELIKELVPENTKGMTALIIRTLPNG
ncbi:MAG: cyclase family protein, partial [Bacteroidota bacterium]|nr:cyclase family protein [Bacteroidota bacterium]